MACSSTAQTVTNYLSTLTGATKQRYICKLQCLHGGPGISMDKLLCPYDIPDVQWVDDVSKWPPVEFGHLYVYFVETPGGYTLEAMKAYKSLEAYNYYYRLVPSFYTCTLYKLMLLTQSLVAGYIQCIFMILVMASTVF